jgi:hypothetical protein
MELQSSDGGDERKKEDELHAGGSRSGGDWLTVVMTYIIHIYTNTLLVGEGAAWVNGFQRVIIAEVNMSSVILECECSQLMYLVLDHLHSQGRG